MRLFILILLLAALPTKADTPGAGSLGAGIIIGAPTALTGKYWVNNSEAVDFGLSFWGGSGFFMYGDYHWTMKGLFGNRTRFVSQLTPYIGAGGGIVTWNEYRGCGGKWSCPENRTTGSLFLARVPVGVEWYPADPPIGVFVELVPGITIVPSTWGYLDFGIGIRYYF